MISRRTLLSLPALAAAAPLRPDRSAIDAEVLRRAESYAAARHLVVDYYRIRRQLAYPLPVRSLSLPAMPVPTISDYPWSFWMAWALEERVNALGSAAAWFGRADFGRAVAGDLEALAGWPKYCQYKRPDLTAGHMGRTLWAAATRWPWVGGQLRDKIRAGCRRLVEEVLPMSDAWYGPLKSRQELLSQADLPSKLANIPLIGTVGAALAASVCSHPALPALNDRLGFVAGAVLDLRGKGVTEAVGYDGYILDFVADWLTILDAAARASILKHPNFRQYLEQSYMLSAPGAAEQVAELSDVEPRQMPFHFSAQAKLANMAPDAARSWYLASWPVDWIRTDALAALRPLVDSLGGPAPAAGALRTSYAAVLRSGWQTGDLAAVVSCNNSPMSHVQTDNGTVAIGTAGRWLICDPGYQQYMRDVERDFTLGAGAHNYPVVDGAVQQKKQPRLLSLERLPSGVLQARLELADCYAAQAGLSSVVRSVWLVNRDAVVIADRIEAAAARKISYSWHGDPGAAWWDADGWMLLRLPGVDFWFGSPQAKLSLRDVVRHPGSRGQLTVSAAIDFTPVTWWVFSVSAAPPTVRMLEGGRALTVSGTRFDS